MRLLVVVVLAVDAVLLAITELAWIGLRAGAVPIPLAALVAAVTTPVLVLAADAAMPGSRAPLAVLGVWLATIVVVGLWSPVGAGVIVGDWRAILLVGGGLLPGVVAASRVPRPVTAR
jgi:hypothetical protein